MQVRKCLVLVAAVGLASCFSQQVARCEIFAYDFTGTVNLVFGNSLGISTGLGDSVSGRFLYDSTAIDMNADAGIGNYFTSFPSRFSVRLGGIKAENEGEFRNVVWNNYEANDAFSVFDNSGEIRVNGVTQPGQIELQLYDRSMTSFSSDVVPAILNLANFNMTFGEVAFVANGLWSGVTFRVDTLTPIDVPEPSALLLCAMLGMAVSVTRRR
jgi:hypothetical protein